MCKLEVLLSSQLVADPYGPWSVVCLILHCASCSYVLPSAFVFGILRLGIDLLYELSSGRQVRSFVCQVGNLVDQSLLACQTGCVSSQAEAQTLDVALSLSFFQLAFMKRHIFNNHFSSSISVVRLLRLLELPESCN